MFEDVQRRSPSDTVDDGPIELGPGRHGDRPGNHQTSTADVSRVEDVVAKAAHGLFTNDDCQEGTDDAHPPGKARRAAHSQEKACDDGRTIFDGDAFVHQFFP